MGLRSEPLAAQPDRCQQQGRGREQRQRDEILPECRQADAFQHDRPQRDQVPLVQELPQTASLPRRLAELGAAARKVGVERWSWRSVAARGR